LDREERTGDNYTNDSTTMLSYVTNDVAGVSLLMLFIHCYGRGWRKIGNVGASKGESKIGNEREREREREKECSTRRLR